MSHKHKTKDLRNSCTLCLFTCQVRVTVGNSGLCSHVSVASFERYLVCWFCTGTLSLVLFKIVIIKSYCYTLFVFCLCLYLFAMNFCWDERSNFDGLARLVFVEGFHCVFTPQTASYSAVWLSLVCITFLSIWVCVSFCSPLCSQFMYQDLCVLPRSAVLFIIVLYWCYST